MECVVNDIVCLLCQWLLVGVIELLGGKVGVVGCSLLQCVVELIYLALHCVE